MTSGFLPRRFGHEPADCATQLEKRDNFGAGAARNDSSKQSVGRRIAELDVPRTEARSAKRCTTSRMGTGLASDSNTADVRLVV